MVRRILGWIDKVEENAIDNDSDTKCAAKFLGAGFVEGFIDGAVIFSIAGIICSIITAIKKLNK